MRKSENESTMEINVFKRQRKKKMDGKKERRKKGKGKHSRDPVTKAV